MSVGRQGGVLFFLLRAGGAGASGVGEGPLNFLCERLSCHLCETSRGSEWGEMDTGDGSLNAAAAEQKRADVKRRRRWW